MRLRRAVVAVALASFGIAWPEMRAAAKPTQPAKGLQISDRSVNAKRMCSGGDYAKLARAVVTGGSFDMQAEGDAVIAPARLLCIKSDRPQSLVHLSIANLHESELTCQPAELVAGDPCGASGDRGELASIVRVEVRTPSGEVLAATSLDASVSVPVPVDLHTNVPKPFLVHVVVPASATPAERVMGQTDSVTFDLLFSAE